MTTKTCILYFTLTPKQEAIQKKWSDSNRINAHIARHLYDYSKAQIEKANLPFIEINESQQSEGNFGEKIANAIENVFIQGYEDVIVVGNDCINFNYKDLTQANNFIKKGQNAIGQTKDGGVYLFSIHRATYSPEYAERLQQLPWCTNELGQSLYDFLQDIGAVASLTTKIDVDDEQSLIKALGHDLPLALMTILRNLILFIFYKKTAHFSLYVCSYALKGLFFRGPPNDNRYRTLQKSA